MSPAAGPDLSMFNRFSVTFRKGDIIFCEYEPGDTFYLIQSGRVQIVQIMGELEKNIDILNPARSSGRWPSWKRPRGQRRPSPWTR